MKWNRKKPDVRENTKDDFLLKTSEFTEYRVVNKKNHVFLLIPMFFLQITNNVNIVDKLSQLVDSKVSDSP